MERDELIRRDGGVAPERVWDIEPLLRRVIAARVADSWVVDDLVQDALARLLASRDRLDEEMLAPYGVVTARNLVVDHVRRAARSQVVPLDRDPVEPLLPEDAVLAAEERELLFAALGRLPEDERNRLVAHQLTGRSATELSEVGVSPATTRVRLARSRAKLRVEYALLARKLTLPTERCRPVLLALAGGDRERQHSAAAARHLIDCEVCASLSEQLVERRRGFLVLLPLIGFRWLVRAVREHPVASTAVATMAAALAVLAAVLSGGSGSPTTSNRGVSVSSGRPPASPAAAPPPSASAVPPTSVSGTRPSSVAPTAGPAPTSSPGPLGTSELTAHGISLLSMPPASLAAFVGQQVTASAVAVQSVVTHDGFWVGSSASRRVWVEFVGPLRTLRVVTGDHVSFVAPLVAQPPGYAAAAGVDDLHGAGLLETERSHLEVSTTAITIEP